MSLWHVRIFLIVFVLTGTGPSLAASDLVPAPPSVVARAYLLLDAQSGQVLAEKNQDKRVEPASLTKIMTAYVVFQEIKKGNLKLDEEVLISKKAWKMKGSRMFVEVGKRVKLKDLLMGMVVQSGNDASVALAEHVAGSEDAFATLMNKYADNLGMVGTHYVNSTGWPHKKHFTTAHDLALLTRASIREFPEFYEWYRVKEFTFNNIRQSNRNRMLWLDDRVDGVKTGHTDSAGYCLVTSAKRDSMRLVSVVLGAKNEDARIAASRKLISYGFRFFETYELYAADEALTHMRIWKGEEQQLPLGLAETLYVTIPRGKYKALDPSMTIETEIVAPAVKGRQYGTVDVKLGAETVTSQPLVALRDIPEGGLWRRMVDNILLMFE